MMQQLAFAGIELEERPAKKTKRAASRQTPPPAKPAKRVAKKKKPLRKAPPMTPAERAEESVRLSRQELEIIARLKAGTATNVELAEIALKYTSRISNIRKAGYIVEVVGRCKSGLTTYQLREQ